MAWMKMTCGACGHEGDMDGFCRTPVYGELPRGVYQCPACGVAIERRHGPAKIHTSGWVEPGRVDLVEVAGRL